MAAVTVDRDRAQLVLVGALVLAVSLVGIALVLNSAIYTHNLASRYQSPADAPVTHARDVRIGAGGLMDHANDGSGGYSTIETDYTDALSDFETAHARVGATNGWGVAVEHDGSVVKGVMIIDDTSSTFDPRSPPDDPTNWTVADEVRVRRFNVTVDGGLTSTSNSTVRSNLNNGPDDDVFVVTFDDSDGTERYVAVYEDSASTNPTVMVHDGSSEIGRCAAGAMPVELDLTGKRLGGSPCPELAELDAFSQPYLVRYNNSNSITGTYGLTVDLRVNKTGEEAGVFTDLVDVANYGIHCGSTNATYHAAGSGNAPRVSLALYAADVNTVYNGSDVSVRSVQRVARDEPRPAPTGPRITHVNVTDESDLVSVTPEFDVEWEVTDPTDDLDEVEVNMTRFGIVNNTNSTGVTGGTASGTLTVNDTSTSLLSENYNITVTAVDQEDNNRSVTQIHEPDDDDGGCAP